MEQPYYQINCITRHPNSNLKYGCCFRLNIEYVSKIKYGSEVVSNILFSMFKHVNKALTGNLSPQSLFWTIDEIKYDEDNEDLPKVLRDGMVRYKERLENK